MPLQLPDPLKDNHAATINPVVGDDNTQGYAVGSKWTNTSTGDKFELVDASTGAAVWDLILDTTAHAATSHAGVSGVGNLYNGGGGPAGTTNHSTLSHSGITGVGKPRGITHANNWGDISASHVISTNGMVSFSPTVQQSPWRFINVDSSFQLAKNSVPGWYIYDITGVNTGANTIFAQENVGGFGNTTVRIYMAWMAWPDV
jgi:hypothetical protein